MSTSPENCPLKKEDNNTDLSNRKRVSKACLECKKRHCRCDHQRPCARCAKLGLDCVDAPACKRGPPKGTSYKKRKRSEESSTVAPKRATKRSKNIKNVQIKVEPAPYVTTTISEMEPPAKKLRLDDSSSTSVPPSYSSTFSAEMHSIVKKEMESPTFHLFNNVASVDAILTPTFLETPKLEQNQNLSDLPDIEDLTVSLCMNSDCGANVNRHCMINELEISPTAQSLSHGMSTPLDPSASIPLILLNDSLLSPAFGFEVFDLMGMSTPTSNTSLHTEEFLIS